MLVARGREREERPRARRGARLAIVVTLSLGIVAGSTPVTQASDRHARAFNWSGHRWTVRSSELRENPGHNRWGDSRMNVRVLGDRTLRVNISRGRSVEVTGPSTGYGTYRWVVRTDLSAIDAFRVVALFVYGAGGEQDVEFARWGDPTAATVGSWVSWRKRTRLGFDFFAVSPLAPYTIEIDWRVGATRFSMRDASGATLLDRTSPSSPPGRRAAPHMSYWVYPGDGANRSPYTTSTVHPPLIMESFSYRR